MTQPRYQEVQRNRIPHAASADGKARVRVIAGEALGVRAVIDTLTPIVLQDWTLDAGADASVTLEKGQSALVYVFEGTARVGNAGKQVQDGQLAILGEGDSVRLRGPEQPGEHGRLLLLAGTPIREPVARYGPFVMNTRQEILQAFDDLRTGRMGEITRTARVA